MKKALCLLLALVMCLGLTGCSAEEPADLTGYSAEEPVDLTGEWYGLQWLRKGDETIASRPEQLADLPEGWQLVPPGTEVIFRDVNSETTIIGMVLPNDLAMMLLHREASGEWKLYATSRSFRAYSFGSGEGSVYPMGDERSSKAFTYALSDGVLTLRVNEDDPAFEGPVERWDDDVIFWESSDGLSTRYDVFVRRDTVMGDDLRLQ